MVVPKFNVDASTLMDEIFGRLIPYSDDKYNCICCNKSFKKIEQARNHLNTKTYKAKHLKFLIN